MMRQFSKPEITESTIKKLIAVCIQKMPRMAEGFDKVLFDDWEIDLR